MILKYRCIKCGCLWRINPPSLDLTSDTWSLYNAEQKPCKVCDNRWDFHSVIEPVNEITADEYRARYIAHMVKLGVDEKMAADDYDNGDQPDWDMEPEESASESMSYWET